MRKKEVIDLMDIISFVSSEWLELIVMFGKFQLRKIWRRDERNAYEYLNKNEVVEFEM